MSYIGTKETHTNRKHVTNPFFRVVIYKEDINEVWLFSSGEKELAQSFYKRLLSNKTHVEIFERVWQKL